MWRAQSYSRVCRLIAHNAIVFCDRYLQRPISERTPIFERIVYDQLYRYLTENKLLCCYQSGFRTLRSTVTALIEATDSWSLNVDRGFVNTVVFLDLKKAFDTVNHAILLSKLQACGIRDSANQWFCSYLRNRMQTCLVNCNKSI